jgi:hypothetical protein
VLEGHFDGSRTGARRAGHRDNRMFLGHCLLLRTQKTLMEPAVFLASQKHEILRRGQPSSGFGERRSRREFPGPRAGTAY